MRDPNRIEPFMEALTALWKENPDYRFGQLVMNLMRDKSGDFQDPWAWEEDEWLLRIEDYNRLLAIHEEAAWKKMEELLGEETVNEVRNELRKDQDAH